MPGCKFIVNGITYEVGTVETEKTLHTSFGDYRPDIIVTATSGKIFYFEIRVTNRKTELYAPKWDELGNDVVEVDTRYFINQKYKNDIPTFDLIYSEGKCYIKSYTRKDYDHLIGTRKVEWKRQDKLDYKIQWERLDWFWNALSEYKKNEATKDNVIEAFDAMDISDRTWCYQNIKGKSCVDIKQELAENISRYYMQKIYDLQNDDKNMDISIIQKSPLIYTVYIKYNITFNDYQCHVDSEIEIKMKNKIFMYDSDTMNILMHNILELSNFANDCNIQLNYYKKLMKLPYIKSIHPKSHHVVKMNNIRHVPFVVEYEDYIHSKYIYETIGVKEYYMFIYNVKTHHGVPIITEDILLSDYKMFKNNAMQNLQIEIQSCVLQNISDLKKIVDERFDNAGNYQLFYHKNKIISKFEYSNTVHKETVLKLDDKTNLSTVYKTVFKAVYYKHRKMRLLKSVMKKYLTIINQSKNGVWHISENKRWNDYNIYIETSDGIAYGTNFKIVEPYSKNSIEKQLSCVMNGLASGLYGDIRLLEVNNSIE